MRVSVFVPVHTLTCVHGLLHVKLLSGEMGK